MSGYRDLFLNIASELRVVSRTAYAHPALDGLSAAARGRGSIHESIRGSVSLTGFVYLHYYLSDDATLQQILRDEISNCMLIRDREDPALGRRLRSSTHGRGYADTGWTVTDVSEGSLHVSRNGVRVRVRSEEIIHDNGSRPSPSVGEVVQIRFPNARPYACAGYYTAISDWGPPDVELPKVRIYVNVTPSGAPDFLQRITSALGDSKVKAVTKILNHPSAYTRPDSSVICVGQHDYHLAIAAITGVCAELRHCIRSNVPAFAKRLGPGLAVAEELKRGGPAPLSFGQHRSSIIATALTKAFDADRHDTAGRLSAIAEEFRAAGLDWNMPYLNRDSADVYGLPIGKLFAVRRDSDQHWAGT